MATAQPVHNQLHDTISRLVHRGLGVEDYRHAVNDAPDAAVPVQRRWHLGRADPRTTMRCDRARNNLDRHPNYILAAYMASGTWPGQTRWFAEERKWISSFDLAMDGSVAEFFAIEMGSPAHIWASALINEMQGVGSRASDCGPCRTASFLRARDEARLATSGTVWVRASDAEVGSPADGWLVPQGPLS